jgi:cytochrome b561
MGLENNAQHDGSVTSAADTANDSGSPSDQAAPVPARPRKLVALHWLTALCVTLAAILILARDEVSARALRMWLLEGHRHFGLLVLILFFVRMALRVRLGKLPAEAGQSRIVHVLAVLNHLALYALLLAQPLLGWTLSSAQGKPVHFFGLTLPALVGADEDLADRLQGWHQDAAWLLLALVSLHIAAALWHHFVARDGVLRRMLPQRQR